MKPNPNMTNGRQQASKFFKTSTSTKSPGESQLTHPSTKKIFMTVLKLSAQQWPQQMQGLEETSTAGSPSPTHPLQDPLMELSDFS